MVIVNEVVLLLLRTVYFDSCCLFAFIVASIVFFC